VKADLSGAIWRKSTASQDNGGCVEVAEMPGHIAIRDSKQPDGPVLVFSTHEWDCFLDGVAKGEFPRPTSAA
jgi:hypothetical protein